MVTEGLETEVLEIFSHIHQGHNFLLSGGAGSGKTYSLVQVIKTALEKNPTSMIACMTYTNSAVKEIERRVNHKNLSVTTIHDFLWDNIKGFQKDLKQQLINLINDENSAINSTDAPLSLDYFDNLKDGIQYKEWLRINEGIISHDEVLELANAMFKNSKLLCDILKDKFKFIFVDEYQDTNPLVIDIFLTQIKKSSKKNIIGFFGDSMQSIYDESIGDLNAFIASGDVFEIQKTQNRRNPKSVIDLANRLRNDGLTQIPSDDFHAPNMLNGVLKHGNIKFVYSSSEDIQYIKAKIGWNFDDILQTKELNLTHNLIAPQAGFQTLMDIYDKDKILEYKKRVVDYIKTNNIDDDFTGSTFKDVISQLGISPTPMQKAFIDDHLELFDKALETKFLALSKIFADKNSLIDDKKHSALEEGKKGSKRDAIIKHLFKIENNIFLYRSNQYNDFIRKTEFHISSIQSKRDIRTIIETLEAMSTSSIQEVIEYADMKNICKKDDKLLQFIEENQYLYDRIKNVEYQQFRKLYLYLEGYTPFSTQHKIKGEEFDNVFVVMDNGGWNNYNFEYLFDGTLYNGLTPAKKRSYPNILSRTQKIFYVCCTRAKEKLVIFFHSPSSQVVNQAEKWFGSENLSEV